MDQTQEEPIMTKNQTLYFLSGFFPQLFPRTFKMAGADGRGLYVAVKQYAAGTAAAANELILLPTSAADDTAPAGANVLQIRTDQEVSDAVRVEHGQYMPTNESTEFVLVKLSDELAAEYHPTYFTNHSYLEEMVEEKFKEAYTKLHIGEGLVLRRAAGTIDSLEIVRGISLLRQTSFTLERNFGWSILGELMKKHVPLKETT